MRLFLLATTAALGLAACSDNSDTATDTAATDMDVSQAAPAMAMADYATNAAMSDMYEIESSRLAATKASSDEVKQFAERMIADHTRTTNSLKTFVQQNGGGITLPMELDARHQGMIDQLQGASGAEFDRMYMMQQRAAHDEALALHRGYAEGGDNEQARELARTTVGVIEQHHQMLRSAMPGGGSASGSGAVGGMTGGSANTGMTGSGNATGGTTVTPSRGVSTDTSRSSGNPTRTNANGTTSPPQN